MAYGTLSYRAKRLHKKNFEFPRFRKQETGELKLAYFFGVFGGLLPLLGPDCFFVLLGQLGGFPLSVLISQFFMISSFDLMGKNSIQIQLNHTFGKHRSPNP